MLASDEPNDGGDGEVNTSARKSCSYWERAWLRLMAVGWVQRAFGHGRIVPGAMCFRTSDGYWLAPIVVVQRRLGDKTACSQVAFWEG